ncbi:MAG TPA: carboxypeptidase regulatory-like domain-containing protein [Planctomycetota bacterium]|nr:carboxypeptidase regulatory-like domain-containing protein [Planctomycetota bacterium]
MANRASFRLAALLLVLGIGLALFARSFLDSGLAASDASPPLSAEALERAADPVPAPKAIALVTPEAELPPVAAAPAARSESEARAAAATPEALELAEAAWVSGTLRFPEGTPIGETVDVIATGKKFKHREMHRARVAADGSFRVAFAKETKQGKLTIDAPHLYLSAPVTVKLAEAARDVVLEPDLGGRIFGVVHPPEGAVDAGTELEKASVNLFTWSMGSGESQQRFSKLDAEHRFELRGVPLHGSHHLSCDTKSWAPSSVDDVAVELGGDVTVDLTLERGVRLSGKVVDESGQLVPGARIGVRVESEGGRHSSSSGELAAKDGTFDLRGKEPGKIQLTAQKKGYVDGELDCGALVDGDVREGLELKLTGGGAIAGRVLWPDGAPAEKAMVSAVPRGDEERDFFGAPGEAVFPTGADGAFRISGLGDSAVDVRVVAKPRDEPAETEKSTAKPKTSLSRKAKWTAKLEAVVPGNDALVLTLQPGYVLTGRVVDDLGAPVKSVQVVATAPEGELGPRGVRGQTVQARSSSEDGAFALEGVPEGAWSVQVRAKGFVACEPIEIAVPDQLALGTLTLARNAVVRGVVRGPDGKPNAKAVVELASPEADRSGGMQAFAMGGSGNRTIQTKSDAQGRFEFKTAPTGDVKLTATRDGFAASETLEVSVAPGETREGLELTLRRGGRLAIEVRSANGGKVGGRELQLYSRSADNRWRQARTDPSGRATIEGLEPGEWQVTAQPTEEEVKALAGDENSPDHWELRSSLEKSASVTVADGETVSVVLGAPPRAPVELRGVVKSGSAPLAGARVSASLQSEHQERSSKFARCDASGAYRMTLDEPGKYSIAASAEGMNPSQWKSVEVPEASTFTYDIELPTGSIAGRVVGPDGAPLDEAWVNLALERSDAERRSDGVQSWGQTDKDGAFRFQNLPAGGYKITASKDQSQWNDRGEPIAPRAPLSREASPVVELTEGGAVRDVVIQLKTGGALHGLVRDASGRPAKHAFITVRDASGAPRDDLSSMTSEDGRYECSGLGEGLWTVRAMREGEVSGEHEVRVAAGQKTVLDLELRAGTKLSVEVQDREGTRVGASITVTDAKGREVRVWQLGGGEAGEPQTVGPLGPGAYTITASNHDGNQVSTSITVAGEATRSVRLKFGD